MQSEVKFRAWDKKNSKWFEPTFEAYKGRLEDLHVDLSGSLMLRTLDGCAHESTFPDRFTLVRFTGLQDIHGKDIYEGDILEYVGQYNRRRVVEWKVSYNRAGWNFGIGKTPCWEIVGNIYENGELSEL